MTPRSQSKYIPRVYLTEAELLAATDAPGGATAFVEETGLTYEAKLTRNGALFWSRVEADVYEPVGWLGAANLTTPTAWITNTSYFVYLGKARGAYTSMKIRCHVEEAYGGGSPVWAEVGLFVGDYRGVQGTVDGVALVERCGFEDVSTVFDTVGLKTVEITTDEAEIHDGSGLWVAFGSQSGQPFQLRAGLAETLQACTYAQEAGRISTFSGGFYPDVTAATLALPMLRVAPPNRTPIF